MTVYEQQARALKEIAAELKGIRRALDIIGNSLKQDGYRADITIVDELVGQGDEPDSPPICGINGKPCNECYALMCEHRKEGDADNG